MDDLKPWIFAFVTTAIIVGIVVALVCIPW